MKWKNILLYHWTWAQRKLLRTLEQLTIPKPAAQKMRAQEHWIAIVQQVKSRLKRPLVLPRHIQPLGLVPQFSFTRYDPERTLLVTNLRPFQSRKVHQVAFRSLAEAYWISSSRKKRKVPFGLYCRTKVDMQVREVDINITATTVSARVYSILLNTP